MDRFRELARDPHLDPGNREALDRLLHDYDTVWPSERRRRIETIRRWNALIHRAPDGFAARMPEYDGYIHSSTPSIAYRSQ